MATLAISWDPIVLIKVAGSCEPNNSRGFKS